MRLNLNSKFFSHKLLKLAIRFDASLTISTSGINAEEFDDELMRLTRRQMRCVILGYFLVDGCFPYAISIDLFVDQFLLISLLHRLSSCVFWTIFFKLSIGSDQTVVTTTLTSLKEQISNMLVDVYSEVIYCLVL